MGRSRYFWGDNENFRVFELCLCCWGDFGTLWVGGPRRGFSKISTPKKLIVQTSGYPGQKLYASVFFVVLDRQWPGCPGIWVGTSQISQSPKAGHKISSSFMGSLAQGFFAESLQKFCGKFAEIYEKYFLLRQEIRGKVAEISRKFANFFLQ